MLVAIVHFSVGAIAGAVFHVLREPLRPRPRRRCRSSSAALYGLLMWIVNFYLDPRLAAAAAGRRGLRAASSCRRGSRRSRTSIYGADARRAAAARTLRAVSAGDARMMRASCSLASCSRCSPAAGAGAAPPTDALRARARRSTRRYCVGCHGVERRRQGPAADDADRQAARLHQGHLQVPLDAERAAADRRGSLPHHHAAACTAPRCRSGRCSPSASAAR